MPKAATKKSSPSRAKPYSAAIKPGDTTKSKPKASKPLAEKPAKALNAAPTPDEDSKPKKQTKSKKPKPPTEQEAPSDKGSFFDITLETNPTTGSVPIYDTCSTVRQKINALLGKDNTKPENGIPGQFKKDGTPKVYTKARFLKDIGGGTPATLERFLKAKKMMGGAESPVYPGAYAFFEKKRIFEGKKKTAGRLKVEEDRPNGLPLRDPNHMRMWMTPDEKWSDLVDEYGHRPNGLPLRDPNNIKVWLRPGENPADFLDEYGHRPNGLKLRDPNHMRIFVQKGENPADFLDDMPNGMRLKDPNRVYILCEAGANPGVEVNEYGNVI